MQTSTAATNESNMRRKASEEFITPKKPIPSNNVVPYQLTFFL